MDDESGRKGRSSRAVSFFAAPGLPNTPAIRFLFADLQDKHNRAVKYKNSPELTQAGLEELKEFFGCHTTEIVQLDKEDRVELEILLATLWGYN